MSTLAAVHGGQQWVVVGIGVAVVSLICLLLLVAAFMAADRADKAKSQEKS